MSRCAMAFGLMILGGCPDPVGTPTPTGDDDVDDDTMPGDDDDDTLITPAEVGSLIVAQTLPTLGLQTGETLFAGVFVADADGILNLAQCVGARDAFCAREWPADIGDSVLVQDFDPGLLGLLDTRGVGPTVRLGPWLADYAYDSAADLGFYFKSWEAATPASGGLGVSFAGGDDWGGYDGTDVLFPPTPMVVVSHDPLRELEFFDADPVALRWEPGTRGAVYLLVSTDADRRLHRLEDDGAFDLDLSGYRLIDGAEVELVLGRWTSADLDVDSDDLSILIQSNQPLRGKWRNIGQRDDLSGSFYDTCAEAEAAEPVVEGHYFGSFSSFSDDLDPGASGCTGFAARGPEAFVPIDVPPDVELTATYSLADDDASLYLVTDCDVAGTCLDGSDGTGQETVAWLNDTGAPQRVYLVLDAFEDVTSEFRLDIALDARGGDILMNTCAEAILQGPVASGSYGGILTDHLNLLEPSCALYPAGGEGMVEVFLEAGETLVARANTPGTTPVTYLLSNCSIADSCFAFGGAQLQYTNSTPFGQRLYLVVDSPLGIGEYFLDVEIQ